MNMNNDNRTEHSFFDDTLWQNAPIETDKEAIARLTNCIAALETAYAELTAALGVVHEKHTQDAIRTNFIACGCDWCLAYRDALGIEVKS